MFSFLFRLFFRFRFASPWGATDGEDVAAAVAARKVVVVVVAAAAAATKRSASCSRCALSGN